MLLTGLGMMGYELVVTQFLLTSLWLCRLYELSYEYMCILSFLTRHGSSLCLYAT